MSSTLQHTLRQALALYEDGQPHEAAALCDAVLTLDPENSDAWQIAGLAHLDQGMNTAAKDAFERTVDLAPEIAGNHVNLATSQLRLGKTKEALRSLERAFALQADMPEAHFNLGNTLLACGRPSDAEKAFAQAISLRPGYAEALNNLGQLLNERGDTDAAVRHFQSALDAVPGYGPAWSNLCGALLDLGRIVDAITAGRRAVLVQSDSARAHYNLGNAFAAAPIPAEAAACYRRALEIDPVYADAFVNLGIAHMQLRDCEQAIECFDWALAIDAELPEANWNKALALLLAGRLEEAWRLYEWRWRAVKGLTLPNIVQPHWDGAAGAGRTLLVHCEQAYGDALQVARYLPLLRRRGWRVVLECPPKLERLFANAEIADRVIPFGAARPEFDSWLPIMSLPQVFETTLDTIPADFPYLDSRPATAVCRENREAGRYLKVGLVWQGSLTNDRGRFRSCRLADLVPLFRLPKISFHSLQSQLSTEDATLLRQHSVPDLESGRRNFADTAAVVQGLDLVITVDTAMAHLTGALGRPVWTLLSAFPDWRWLLDRDDSPWYPSMRLFRQHRIGDWASVVEDVSSALQRMIEVGGHR